MYTVWNSSASLNFVPWKIEWNKSLKIGFNINSHTHNLCSAKITSIFLPPQRGPALSGTSLKVQPNNANLWSVSPFSAIQLWGFQYTQIYTFCVNSLGTSDIMGGAIIGFGILNHDWQMLGNSVQEKDLKWEQFGQWYLWCWFSLVDVAVARAPACLRDQPCPGTLTEN